VFVLVSRPPYPHSGGLMHAQAKGADILAPAGTAYLTATRSPLSGANLGNFSENYLTISMDRKIYSPGDTMNITIKNISDNRLYFSGLYYDLFFEKWDGTTWQHYQSIRQPMAITSLQPGEEEHHTHELSLYSGEEYALGRYRVGTAGIFSLVNIELGRTPPAYAEFEVREPTWIVLAVVVIAVVGIAVVYLVSRRMRG